MKRVPFDRNGPARPLTDRDRAFLARHRKLNVEDDRPARGSAERIRVAGEIRGETAAAILFFDGAREAWLPKSQVRQVTQPELGVIELELPEWLAKEKGLI